MAVEITRKELSAVALRREAGRTKDAKASRRMLALALVLEGRSRTEAAEICGMDRQTLRDWVHRYNAEGLAGLADRALPGRAPMLNPEQMSELAAIVETGPETETETETETDGVERWRRIDNPGRTGGQLSKTGSSRAATATNAQGTCIPLPSKSHLPARTLLYGPRL